MKTNNSNPETQEFTRTTRTQNTFSVPSIGTHDGNGKLNLKHISSLGLRILPNRQVRFAGRNLRGVTLPKKISSQMSIIKTLLARYSPCIRRNQNGFKMDERCFNEKENEFLKLLAKNMSDLRFKYIL